MVEFFEGTLWLVEEVEEYWIPDITTKTIAKLPKCPYCGTRFGTIALKYKYCPECGKRLGGDRVMEKENNNTAIWIEHSGGFNLNCSDNYHCSNCGNTEKFATLYCSYCGKKMINEEPLYWKSYCK